MVELPLPPAEALAVSYNPGTVLTFSRLRGRYRALVVDDDSSQRSIVRRSLEAITEGWIIDEAPNGEASVEMATAGAAYDLITMGEQSFILWQLTILPCLSPIIILEQ